MSFPAETFAEHARRREARAKLKEGRASINERIQAFAGAKRSNPNQREMQALDEQAARLDAKLDQGQREPLPPPTDGNAVVNARLRAAFHHEPFDNDDRGATSA
jgi:hypothetical protein